MITKNIVTQPKSVVQVDITMPWADIQKAWDETLARMSADVEIAGFRKGQAPTAMVEQNLGSKLSDEVFKVVMPQALIEALKGSNIIPIDYPQYKIVSFQKGADLKFSARITQRPVVAVQDYKSLKAQKPAQKTVADDDVNKMIDELFKRWKARQPQGVIPPPVQTAQGVSGSMSFNQQPTNNNPQPTPTVSDAPDDNFAKAVGADSLVDLKTKIRQDLENEAKYNNELDFEEAILQEVEKITQVEIPEVLVHDELNRMLVSLQRTVTERGMLLDEYLKTQNKAVDQLKSEWRPQAEKNVRMELGLSEIAKLEGINISDDELQSEIDKIQDARVKAQFAQEEPKMHLRHALRQTKTLNLLKTLIG
ncbi:hypothetical protein HYW46_01910 [Candidatus Daviesbacteria bacterium]|nr:hypothetical protein [Candidatus Daviesbacteria bacterium]